jgi:LCP family protein required for cell wall assembly
VNSASPDDPPDAVADGDSGVEPERRIASPAHRRQRRWLRRMLVAFLVIATLGCLGTVGGFFALKHRYESAVTRQPMLDGLPRPTHPASEDSPPLNLLLLGSDNHMADPDTTVDPTGERSDTIMIIHVVRGHRSAYVVSIPRDSYVDVPAGGDWKGGYNKINAAFAFGGARLAAQTVYRLTRIPLDGALVVNLGGVKRMVATLGGVHVCIPYTVRSAFAPHRVWTAGCHDLGPDEAEDFMRQRKAVPGGDLGRIHDQQLVIKALADKVASAGMLQHPLTLDRLIDVAAHSVTVDQDLDITNLVMDLKGIDPGNLKFATAPVTKTDLPTPAGTAVELDAARCGELFAALRDDDAARWFAAHPSPAPDAGT